MSASYEVTGPLHVVCKCDFCERKREMKDDELAELFHLTYELLAKQFNYVTREDTRKFDPASQHGRLMIATCSAIIPLLQQENEYICKCGLRVVPHRCKTGEEF